MESLIGLTEAELDGPHYHITLWHLPAEEAAP
jgi:hypothetical protein